MKKVLFCLLIAVTAVSSLYGNSETMELASNSYHPAFLVLKYLTLLVWVKGGIFFVFWASNKIEKKFPNAGFLLTAFTPLIAYYGIPFALFS